MYYAKEFLLEVKSKNSKLKKESCGSKHVIPVFLSSRLMYYAKEFLRELKSKN